MSTRNLFLAFVAILALAAVACSGGGAFPLDVEDDAGQTVRLEGPPKAIASLSAGHTEILFALGAGDQIAAVDKFSDYPAAAADLPHLDAFSPSIESIAALEPDLVILSFDPRGLQEALDGLGIPVLFLGFPSSVQEVFDQVELLGRVTGHEDEAETVAAEMRDGIEEITGKLGGLGQGPSVFHELTIDLWTVGPGSFVHDLYTLLKAENIAEAAGQPSAQMSAEAIIAADPEVIVLADLDAGASVETVAARPGWGSISAVRNDRIYAVDPNIVSRPGPRLVEALEVLARILYPERFQ